MSRILIGCAAVAAIAACSGGKDNNVVNSPDADGGGQTTNYIVIDVGPDTTEPQACPTTNRPNSPVIALDWDEPLETYPVPGESPENYAIDYEVVPPALVERVELAFDFDPRLTNTDPGGADAEPLVIEERCPTSIDAAMIRDVVSTPTVVSATVTAASADGSDARRGRISVSTGTSTATVLTNDLDAGAALDDWYMLFEPLGGIARITIAPADLSRTSFSLDGLPPSAGIIALVQSDELRWDAASRVVYAPASFGATWRQRVSGWYGRLRAADEDEETPYRLTALVPPDRQQPAIFRVFSGDFTQSFQTTSRLILSSAAVEQGGEVTVPCDKLPLDIHAAGYVEVDIDDGDARTIAPGESSTIEPACAGEDATFALTLRALTQRPQAVVISTAQEAQ